MTHSYPGHPFTLVSDKMSLGTQPARVLTRALLVQQQVDGVLH